jgi:hypothetical protein
VVIGFPFEGEFEVVERAETGLLEFADPADVDFVEGNGVEEVEFFASVTADGDEIGCFEEGEVLGDSLAGHLEAGAELAEGLAASLVEAVEELTAAGVGEGFEDFVDFLHWASRLRLGYASKYLHIEIIGK